MRNSYDRTRSTTNKNWIWWTVIGSIITIYILSRFLFGGGEEDSSAAYMTVTPLPESTVYISMSSASKTRISQSEKLYATDKSVSVQVGGAKVENNDLTIDLDKTTDLTYKSQSLSGHNIKLSKGRAWVSVTTGEVDIELKFLNLVLQSGDIAMIEQNSLSSTVYMIVGTGDIKTTLGETQLTEGNRIMIAGSDLSNPQGNLSSLVGMIDDTITSHPLFIRNNGKSLLRPPLTGSTSTGESLIDSGSTLNMTPSTKFIEITDPIDGTLIKNNSFAIMGNILSNDVKKVTLNDVSATISPVNKTFVLQNVTIPSDIFNIVYKAYGENDRLLDRGVISVFAAKGAITPSGAETIIPDNFPISNKDFPLIFPKENPYITTDNRVTVEGSVPKGKVAYIVVNDYRLQKFVNGGTRWYYYANTATETMKEGINLYTIKFYSSSNELLYTQVFTIVKESKNASVSGEITQ